ncbi:membrane lipoprotein lipid attachment site-containing protein [Flavobacterium soli]|uniref:membrane lipoprotein lipid attachment site-containing protein n=1 Tax=Flavobacterium soli TaxID=344881 RepID=UPI00040C934F|nr:membrane lipoprotein lipid attachment site-containing protein [Flavobacterium soli]
MKKILFLLSVIALLLSSCSSDDGGTTNSDFTLVKKAVSVEADGSEGMTFNYSYSGNKINTVQVLNGQQVKYFYTGNLITKVERYETTNGMLEFEVVYQYDENERLIKEESKYFINSSLTTRNFTYEPDGTVSFLVYSGEIGSITELRSTGKYFLNEDQEVAKVETTNINTSSTSTANYTYDNQNNVFKNVLGWDKLFSPTGNYHNVLSTIYLDANQVVLETSSNQYEYNSAGYPTSVTTTIGSTSAKVNYFY